MSTRPRFRCVAVVLLMLTGACSPASQPAPTATAPKPAAAVSPAASPATSPVASPAASPAASPVASPVASPAASPVASPMASPAASPAASPSPAAGLGAGLALADLRDASGQIVGAATFTATAGGVQVTAQVRNLPPGVHGIHFHAVGRCDPPDFVSAGDHLNPTNRQHGLRNPQGPHAGDLPNLTVEANGTGSFQATNAAVTLEPGAASLFDADGTALVIHDDPDDEATDPTGNSGGRIACGVVARS